MRSSTIIALTDVWPVVHYVGKVTPGWHDYVGWANRIFIDWQLQMVIEGTLKYTFPDGDHPNYKVVGGQIALVPPGIRITQELTPHGSQAWYYSTHFLFGKSPDSVPSQLPPELMETPEPELMRTLFQRLLDAYSRPNELNDALASGFLREIFLRLLIPRGTGGSRDIIAQMTAWLDLHLIEHPTRSDLSRQFNLTPEYINQLFRRHLGMTPGDYVRRHLMRKAYQMLSVHGARINEVADALGFANQFHFARYFRSVYGYAPSRVLARRSMAYSRPF